MAKHPEHPEHPERHDDSPVQVIHGALTDGGYAPVLLVRDGHVTDLRVLSGAGSRDPGQIR